MKKVDGRIVIVDDGPIARLDIRDTVIEARHGVVGETADGSEVIEVCKKTQPDLILVDVQMPISDGLKTGEKTVRDQLASSIVFLSAYSDMQDTNKAKKLGTLGYLVKPLDEKSLVPTIEMSIEQDKRTQLLLSQIDKLSLKLEERKIIEKIKGILVKENHTSEEETYQMLRILGMDKRTHVSEITELIVVDGE